MKNQKKMTITVDHWFNEQELAETGESLSHKLREQNLFEIKKRQVNNIIKKEGEAISETVNRLSNSLINGYEEREVETVVERCFLHQKVIYTDVKTGQVVLITDFSELDRQLQLDSPSLEDMPEVISATQIMAFNRLVEKREQIKQETQAKWERETAQIFDISINSSTSKSE